MIKTLCALASNPFGAIWGEDQTAMHVRTDGDSTLDVALSTEAAPDIWNALVGRTTTTRVDLIENALRYRNRESTVP